MTAQNQSIEAAQGIVKGRGQKLKRQELGTLLQHTLPVKLLHAASRSVRNENNRNAYEPIHELNNTDAAFQMLAHEKAYALLHVNALNALGTEGKCVRQVTMLVRLPYFAEALNA